MVRKKALAAKEAVKTEEVSAEAVKEAASAKKEAEAAESENRKAAAAEKAEPAKAARGRKAAAKKTAKKAEMKTSLSVQYMGKDISEKDIIALVKKRLDSRKAQDRRYPDDGSVCEGGRKYRILCHQRRRDRKRSDLTGMIQKRKVFYEKNQKKQPGVCLSAFVCGNRRGADSACAGSRDWSGRGQ